MQEEAAWKLAGLICCLEHEMVLTVTGFPLLFKEEFFVHVSSLA